MMIKNNQFLQLSWRWRGVHNVCYLNCLRHILEAGETSGGQDFV
jgi:hypothetical protein